MDRIKKISLYQKLIMTMIIFALIPLLILGHFGYQKFSSFLLNHYAESNWQTVYQIQSQVDRQLTDIQELMATMATNPDIQTMLIDPMPSTTTDYHYARFFYDFTLLQLAGQPSIATISLLNYQGKFFDSKGRFSKFSDIPTKYKLVIDKLADEYAIIQTIYNEEKNEYIPLLAQKISDIDTGTPIGVVLVELNSTVLNKLYESVDLNGAGFVFLLNDDQRIMYHPTLETGTHFPDAPIMTSDTEHYFINPETDDTYLYLQSPFTKTNWTLYGAISYGDLASAMSWFRNSFYIFMFIMISFLLFLGYFLRRHFIKPIRKLQNVMRQVEKGDLTARAFFNQQDEIGNLGESFNMMVERIEHLIKKVYEVQLNESRALLYQKNAEFESLQKQITPHFLYNTLNSVSWFAGRKGIREIEFVIDSLSDMLRYSLEPSSAFTTLEKEIANIENYIMIIDFRYESAIEITINIAPDLQHVELPRLTMQPIIENAIIHGFEEINGDECIEITARRSGEDVLITMKDNGQGMSTDKMKLLNSKFQADSDKFLANDSSSIGMINVHRRIRLRYGIHYGIKVESELGVGTIVRMTVPLE